MSTPNQPDRAYVDVTDDQRERLCIRYIERISNNSIVGDEADCRVTDISASLKLPEGLRASCTFEVVNSKGAMVSILVQSPVDEDLQSTALTKGALNSIPFRDINQELVRLLDDLGLRWGAGDIKETFGPGTAVQRHVLARRKAPTRKNSNWPRLLRVAIRYSELDSDPAYQGKVHESMKGDGMATSIAMSRQWVKFSRAAGFLNPTGERAKGSQLSGLTTFLKRKGFVKLDKHGLLAVEDRHSYFDFVPAEWDEAVRAYNFSPERLEEMRDWMHDIRPAEREAEALLAHLKARDEEKKHQPVEREPDGVRD